MTSSTTSSSGKRSSLIQYLLRRKRFNFRGDFSVILVLEILPLFATCFLIHTSLRESQNSGF